MIADPAKRAKWLKDNRCLECGGKLIITIRKHPKLIHFKFKGKFQEIEYKCIKCGYAIYEYKSIIPNKAMRIRRARALWDFKKREK